MNFLSFRSLQITPVLNNFTASTVIDATADTLITLAQNKVSEPTLTTPALVGTQILIRTEKALYAFASAN